MSAKRVPAWTVADFTHISADEGQELVPVRMPSPRSSFPYRRFVNRLTPVFVLYRDEWGAVVRPG